MSTLLAPTAVMVPLIDRCPPRCPPPWFPPPWFRDSVPVCSLSMVPLVAEKVTASPTVSEARVDSPDLSTSLAELTW